MRGILTSLALIFALIGANAQVITNGLIGYYPLDGNANDLSPNGYHGTVNGAVPDTGINGLPNTCYNFTGGVINVNHTIIRPDTSLTISLWMYPDSTTVSGSYSDNVFIQRREKTGGYDGSDLKFPIARYQGEYYVAPDCTTRVCTSTIVDCGSYYRPFIVHRGVNKWNHLVVEYELDTMRTYIDNIMVNESVDPKYKLEYEISFEETTLGYLFNGKIDDINIFNRVLTPAEKTTLFNQRTGGATSVTSAPKASIDIQYSQVNKNLTVNGGSSTVIEVYSLDGSSILSVNGNSADLSGLSSGVYLVKATSGQSTSTKKIVVQ